MIVFDLKCGNGHQFEGWFDDGDAFEAQRENDLIACPVCDDVNISKLPSAFAIKNASPRPPGDVPAVDLDAFHNRMSEYIEKNFDDVGCDFASEALKIHYGVSEKKGIRGTSTKEEEKMLEKEGVPFFKVPLASPSDPDT
jgi:hypothetical protein